MSDEYDGDCERKPADKIEVRNYFGDREGTGEMGQTRQAGILATGRPNSREREQATFRGKETLRRSKDR